MYSPFTMYIAEIAKSQVINKNKEPVACLSSLSLSKRTFYAIDVLKFRVQN